MQAYLGATKAWAPAAHAMAITADFILSRAGVQRKEKKRFGVCFQLGGQEKTKWGGGDDNPDTTQHDEANL